MQLPLWNQSVYDATQCLDHSPYATLEEFTQQSANSSCVIMKAMDNDSPMDCGIGPWSLSTEQLQVFQYALHENRLRFHGDPSAYQGYSNIVDSPAAERQPSVNFKVHQNGQTLSLETVDGLEDPSQLRPAVESEADSSTPEYLGDDDDLQYAESYMIAGYETLSETL
ncbi:hypothetical protein P168DRAFT_290124 [Aspergillus campestris IBT 28561]|uniref:Uncharacterized protein n=1 Tax=Aspergillus campestris (strain IBT 28561) TaxID=1392248 RepID=A0A2I1D2C3_ASPC2|nr:uncharacterized protein P168DRAFT_290124 [Aspergillus campestris IBT 28561]PKY03998.1 hypothetical protein P168DRAFT_290124 [Aspergillus campestris IBT 28561]